MRGAALGAGALIFGPASSLMPRSARAATLDGAFPQGVASGEPGPRAITLWTRLAELERPARRRSRDRVATPGFATSSTARRCRSSRTATTPRACGCSDGFLAPGEEYHYRFATAAADSPVGRFRTARPADSREPVRIAFFSCQEFIAGFYTAHADLAQQDVDLVVCLGDYIYEQAVRRQPRATDTHRRPAATARRRRSTEYRDKYRALPHRREPARDARRAFPLLAIWDDHEVEDNWAGDKPGRREPRTGACRSSTAAPTASSAFFEHMPRPRHGATGPHLRLAARSAPTPSCSCSTQRQYRDDQP